MRLWERIESTPAAGIRSARFGMLLMCVVGLSWAGIEFLGSFISRENSPYQTVWVRYGTHLVFMLAILGRTEGWKMVRTPRLGRQVFRSLLMLAMPFFFISAVGRGMNLRLVWAMSWISVPMMLLMANIISGEKVAAAQWVAAFIGLAGTWLFIRPPFPMTGGWLLLLPLGMGFSFALYNVLTREMRTERTSANLFHTALWVFIPLSFVMPSVWHTPSPKAALAMVGIGVWGFVILLFLDRALAWAPASLVAPFIYTQCIWSDALELIPRRFHLGLHELLGSILIMGSLAWIFAHECRSNRIVQKPAT